jgi:hypothetical protein
LNWRVLIYADGVDALRLQKAGGLALAAAEINHQSRLAAEPGRKSLKPRRILLLIVPAGATVVLRQNNFHCDPGCENTGAYGTRMIAVIILHNHDWRLSFACRTVRHGSFPGRRFDFCNAHINSGGHGVWLKSPHFRTDQG